MVKESSWCRWLFVLIGVAINVLLAFICDSIGLPLFLDTIGTILVSCIGGILPGIFTALITNAVCTIYNGVSSEKRRDSMGNKDYNRTKLGFIRSNFYNKFKI